MDRSGIDLANVILVLNKKTFFFPSHPAWEKFLSSHESSLTKNSKGLQRGSAPLLLNFKLSAFHDGDLIFQDLWGGVGCR